MSAKLRNQGSKRIAIDALANGVGIHNDVGYNAYGIALEECGKLGQGIFHRFIGIEAKQ